MGLRSINAIGFETSGMRTKKVALISSLKQHYRLNIEMVKKIWFSQKIKWSSLGSILFSNWCGWINQNQFASKGLMFDMRWGLGEYVNNLQIFSNMRQINCFVIICFSNVVTVNLCVMSTHERQDLLEFEWYRCCPHEEARLVERNQAQQVSIIFKQSRSRLMTWSNILPRWKIWKPDPSFCISTISMNSPKTNHPMVDQRVSRHPA